MTVDFFRQVIAEVAPLAEQVFFHVLGEPLLHPELRTLIGICREAQLPVNITTNGDLIRNGKALGLLEPVVRQINFSMHAHHEAPSRVDDILDFVRMAVAERPDLYINFRFWNNGADNAGLLAHIGKTLDAGTLSAPHTRRSLHVRDRIYLNFDRRFDWPDMHREPQDGEAVCHGLESQFAVLCDGRVTICCLDAGGVETLGRIGQTPLENILNGPKANQIRAGWKKKTAVAELCKRCTYRSRFKRLGE